jgi:hypothetical protein
MALSSVSEPSKDIIDLDRTGADHDRPLHRSGVETDVGEPARSIEGLSGVVVDGDVDTNAGEAASAGLVFGRSDEHRRDPTAAMARGNLDVLEFGRIGQGDVEVTHRFVAAPRNQVEPVALVEAREPQRVPHLLIFLRTQHANLHRQVVAVERHGAGSMGERAASKSNTSPRDESRSRVGAKLIVDDRHRASAARLRTECPHGLRGERHGLG